MDIDISECARYLKDKEERRILERENLRRKVMRKLSLLSEVLNNFPGVKKAYIFGSILKKGRFGENSDIDIALEGNVKRDYFLIWGKLEEKLGERVDLRILENNSTSQIIKREGKLVYEREN
ncbi:nucleotidyltransferase domain-containing protein [Candidatus Aerophobetes bacterium]|uniref:Nucleotidyltransferase domain-containing protein n=1 Tax=Aerophobetes bacterium TaxID=2030807 RepID=A0A662D0C9_UNCAE|nr:MAG: nucleotidyltransferase domain-containing protein [Candidatus Aerophobetes bacterium]